MQNGASLQKHEAVFRQSIGEVPFQEKESAAISCLLAFLRLNKQPVNLDTIIDIAPVALGGPTEPLLRFMGRRLGIQMEEVSRAQVPALLRKNAVLVRRQSGYALLLLAATGGKIIAALPGGGNRSISSFSPESDILEGAASFHRLQFRGRGPGLNRRYVRARTYLIPWCPAYQADYCAKTVVEFTRVFSRSERPVGDPGPLATLSCAAVLESHRAMCPSLPQYFGVYRCINLRRATVFVAAHAIEAALSALFESVSRSVANSIEECVRITALLIVDFLTIHPFINGNRRMALAIATRYLALHGVEIDWSGISRVELYYRIRCASKGHVQGLVKLISTHSSVLRSSLPQALAEDAPCPT